MSEVNSKAKKYVGKKSICNDQMFYGEQMQFIRKINQIITFAK